MCARVDLRFSCLGRDVDRVFDGRDEGYGLGWRWGRVVWIWYLWWRFRIFLLVLECWRQWREGVRAKWRIIEVHAFLSMEYIHIYIQKPYLRPVPVLTNSMWNFTVPRIQYEYSLTHQLVLCSNLSTQIGMSSFESRLPLSKQEHLMHLQNRNVIGYTEPPSTSWLLTSPKSEISFPFIRWILFEIGWIRFTSASNGGGYLNVWHPCLNQTS